MTKQNKTIVKNIATSLGIEKPSENFGSFVEQTKTALGERTYTNRKGAKKKVYASPSQLGAAILFQVFEPIGTDFAFEKVKEILKFSGTPNQTADDQAELSIRSGVKALSRGGISGLVTIGRTSSELSMNFEELLQMADFDEENEVNEADEN